MKSISITLALSVFFIVNTMAQNIRVYKTDGTHVILPILLIDSITFTDEASIEPPVADFTANPTAGTGPLEVLFIDLSLNNPESWLWDFGDGNTSTEQFPSYTYSDPGWYTIELTVANAHGEDSEIKLDYITVTIGGSFACGDSTITDYDGNTYATVQIGEQCWMAENLKTTHYRNGTPIENITDSAQWINDTLGAYSWIDNDISWKDHYRGLYNWYATVNVNGLCPEGWKVPSDQEVNVLVTFLDPNANPNANGIQSASAGGILKSTRTDPDPHPRSNSPNPATNNYNFSAYPGGVRWNNSGIFQNFLTHAYIWTTTESSNVNNSWA